MFQALRKIMSASPEVIQRLEQRSAAASQMIDKLKDQLQGLKQASATGPERALATENSRLLAEVDELKRKLNLLEARNGLMQFSGPVATAEETKEGGKTNGTEPKAISSVNQNAAEKKQENMDREGKKAGGNKDKKAKIDKKEKGGGKKPPATSNLVIDVSLLDLRIGEIQEVKLHPDADTLYVEQVDCGEANPRTVVSGLVNNVPIDQMQDKLVILCCNLKPVKMRGILSQAMVMCAVSPEKVEILEPPPGVVPGDRVSIEGYSLSEDFPAQMNPKKKIFEQIQPNLTTNSERVATYKGAPWKVEGKGIVKAPTMANSGIK